MATLISTPVTKFVHNFSTHSLSDFFSQSISRFVPQQENLNYIIRETTKFEKFSELTKIGDASLDNADALIVFSCKYDGPLTSRSSRRTQFEIAKKVLREDFKDGAIFVYHDQDKNFRFSFIRKNYGETGANRYSPWKRYTYFVDPADTNRTFKERIGGCKFSDLETIQQAFSVEKLTKDFYTRLFDWFQWTLSDEIGITYPNDTTIAEDDREKLEVQLIRLTTRLLFCWFIKQKDLVPHSLFDKTYLSGVLKDFDPTSKTDGSYYNAILQNLFFATLNKSIDERAFAKLMNTRDLKTLYRYAELFSISEEKVLELFKPVPFLNGGLFECLDKENPDGKKIYLDGFSRNDKKAANGNYKHRAFIPNCVFFDKDKGIIPILEQYNFTVEENDPNEVQVALDPELLGNVFENLLGAFNKETRDSARKQSGSFYTPREIVSYMVDESLIAYLKQKLPDTDEIIIRELFEQELLPGQLEENSAVCQHIAKELRAVKILDPACGSGAFPMGILNKMLRVLQKLDAGNQESIYDRKLHLIEECIYGIDIQPIATQISKLRFFISLIVEEGRDDAKENYGIRSLPNLETKFVAANTLLGPEKSPAQLTIFDKDELETIKHELLEIRKDHFYAKTAGAKKRLREKDAELRDRLSAVMKENGEFSTDSVKQFSEWNPYDQNESAPFFDLDWMFGMDDGFDIVIGNPPYIQLQNDGGRLAQLYQNEKYETFSRKGDIYSLFYERGWQLLKENGNLCFITSNKWMRSGYGESTRKFFAENTNPLLLIDFAGQKIFEAATVDPNILLFTKAKNEKRTIAYTVKEKILAKLSETVNQNANEIAFDTSENWVILNEIEQRIKAKIEAIGTPLKDWDIQINYGIKTGYNEAFIIDGKKRDELIKEDPKSAEIIRPILRGRDIKKYSYEFADLYVILAHFGSNKFIPTKYPAIYKHLKNHEVKLKQRGQCRYTSNGKTNSKNPEYPGQHHWLELDNNPTLEKLDDFNRQKIVWGELSDTPKFVLEKNGEYVSEASTFLMTGESLTFLVGYLNSKLSKYCFSKIGTTTGVGTIQWKKFTILQLPIPKFSAIRKSEYENLVEKALSIRNDNEKIISICKQFDKMLYEDLEFLQDEINFIETQ